MKQKKSKGALIVSILLLVSLIGMYVGTVIGYGVQVRQAEEAESEFLERENQRLEQEKEEMQTLEETPAPQQSPVFPERVEFEKITGDDYNMYAKITGYFADGNTWQYFTPSYPVTELDPVDELYAWGDTYVFCAGGKVIALDTATGAEKWVNEDFGGYSPACTVDEYRTLYLSGYYGPDLHVVDVQGNTVAHVDQLDSDYYWPYEIRKADDKTVEIVFAMGPEGDTGEGYVLAYDLELGAAIVPEEAAPAETLAWIKTYRAYLESAEANFERGYALIYLDGDDIPELFAQGHENGALISYDAQKDAVKVETFAGDDISYYAGTGVFSANRYQQMESEETFYTYKDGKSERIGTAKMRHYEEDREPDCWWEGEAIPSNDFFRMLSTFRPNKVRAGYAIYYPKQMALAQLDCWYDPSANIYWSWKEEYMETVRQNMDREGRYALVDVDHDGVPELFVQFKESNGEVYTQMQTFNAQTQQSLYFGFSGGNTAYIPDTGIVTDTYVYHEHRSDYIYQVSATGVVEIAEGQREVHDDGGMSCYYNDSKISQAAYEQELAPLFDERAVRIEELLMTLEEILPLLR